MLGLQIILGKVRHFHATAPRTHPQVLIIALVGVIPADVAEIGNLRAAFGPFDEQVEFRNKGFRTMDQIAGSGGGGYGWDIPSVVYQYDIRKALTRLAGGLNPPSQD